MRARAACRPIAPLEGRGARSSDLKGNKATGQEAIRGTRAHLVAAVAKATQALAEREQLPIIVPPPVVNLPVPPEAPEFQIESIQRDDKGQIKTVVKKQVRKKLK